MGILDPLYTAVSWIIVQFHALFSLVFPEDSGWAWGLSIVMLVVVIRICLIPLFVKQIHAQRSMYALQPKIKEIQQRYKDDRERQTQEMMKLYREAGTNPFASCLPLLAQAPFFFALYFVLDHIAKHKTVGVLTPELLDSAAQASIFGAKLSEKFVGASSLNVQIVTVVMIVLMSLSQFITTRQLMVKNTDLSAAASNPFMQQQKILLYVLPVMFAVFGINFPVGVLVYWLTTNVWTMGQQLYVIRRNPMPGSKAYEELMARRKAKEVKTAKAAKSAQKVPAATADQVDTVASPDSSLSSTGSPQAKPRPSGQRQQPVRQPRSRRKSGR